jgi:hypothetical protein
MDNLVCTECGVTYYSAAAADMVARRELCDCGGALVEVEGVAMERVTPQGDPASGPPAEGTGGRRFGRDSQPGRPTG